MNIYAVIPLISVIAYLALIGVVAMRPLARVHKVFIGLLVVSAMWSFSSFILHANFFPTQTLMWNRALLVLAITVPLLFYHFVRVYFNRPFGIGTYLGYATLLGFTIFISQGGILKSSYVVDGILYWEHDISFYLLFVFLGAFMATAMLYLVQGFRRATDPYGRNRIGYLIAAICIWALFALTNVVPALANYSVDHIGNIFFVLIIGYAILRFHLLNVQLVVRKVLTYAILVGTLIGISTGSVLIGSEFLADQPPYSIILFATPIALLLILAARPLERWVQKGVDRLFYRRTYDYRQALLGFGSKMGHILNLDELAKEMLPTMTKALSITQTSLLFQDSDSGDFGVRFVYPKAKDKPGNDLSFNADSPAIAWLDKTGRPLDPEQIDNLPEFKGLWQEEKEQLTKSGLGLLYPLKSRDKLIGILALGEKESGGPYSHEDIGLVASIANQAGIIIENAHLFTQAQVRANTDELTGLYNHRHFHERLEQEIARGSRFGTTFSLIMLDIDLFKSYNDIYGHLAGDQVLRKIGHYIGSSIRSIDLAFRYGGEEFGIILPEARLDDAYKVAERIRKTIESKTSSRAMPITASLGVANWPNDGVMKEEIIGRADAALYQSKQTGRNRTCLSSDILKPETPLIGTELEAKPRALSIIYALAATVDAKDSYTYGHSRKVSEYAVAMSEALKLSQDRMRTIRAAGLLHDIGKVGVPDSILNKKVPLVDEEWKPIKAHPELGVEILRHVIDLVNCLPAIMHHHERYDGRGYPTGLKGDKIPEEARILAIADAYDAMISPRPYRERLSSEKAINELRRCAGTQFDPELVDIFCSIIRPAQPKSLGIKTDKDTAD